jgi:hypothetical protein
MSIVADWLLGVCGPAFAFALLAGFELETAFEFVFVP